MRWFYKYMECSILFYCGHEENMHKACGRVKGFCDRVWQRNITKSLSKSREVSYTRFIAVIPFRCLCFFLHIVRSSNSDSEMDGNHEDDDSSGNKLSDHSPWWQCNEKSVKTSHEEINYHDSVPEILDSRLCKNKSTLSEWFGLSPSIMDSALESNYASLPQLKLVSRWYHWLCSLIIFLLETQRWSPKMVPYKFNDAPGSSDLDQHTMISYSKTLKNLTKKDGSRAYVSH